MGSNAGGMLPWGGNIAVEAGTLEDGACTAIGCDICVTAGSMRLSGSAASITTGTPNADGF